MKPLLKSAARFRSNAISRVKSEVRSRAHLTSADRRAFQAVRRTLEYRRAFSEVSPLVSIVIPTYNRSELLIRAVKSLTNQTYRNIQIIVIGDGCTDDTEKRMAEQTDSRIHFENRPRGKYEGPGETPYFIAGYIPLVHGFSLAEGRFVSQLDDDDQHTPDRVEKLVALAQKRQADLVWHPFHFEQADGSWTLQGCRYLMEGHVTAGAIFFHEHLRMCAIQPELVQRFREPGDWQRIRQMKWLGAKIAFHPDPMLIHYKERTQW